MEAAVDEQAGSPGRASPLHNDRDGEVVLERGPGVRVIADAHPARAGRALAAALGADLADTAAATDLAISERLGRPIGASTPADVIDLRDATGGAGQQAGPSHPEGDQFLDERLAAWDAAAPTLTLALAHVARLRLLAAALHRAERVRARTELAAHERSGELSRPAAGRTADQPSTAPQAVDVPEAPAPPADKLEPGMTLERVRPPASTGPITSRDVRSPDSALIAGGVLLLSIALAGAILLTALPPILAIAPILLGLFVAALIRTAPIWPDRFTTNAAHDSLAASRRTGVSINAPTAGESRQPRASRARAPDVDPKGMALGEGHDWTEEAPRDADYEEPVVGLASETAAVRAAHQLVSSARQAWETAWTELGEQAPADATSGRELDAALARLQQRIVGDHETPGAGSRAASRQRLNELLAGRDLEAAVAAEPGPLVRAVAARSGRTVRRSRCRTSRHDVAPTRDARHPSRGDRDRPRRDCQPSRR
jgi:hypothetical protein